MAVKEMIKTNSNKRTWNQNMENYYLEKWMAKFYCKSISQFKKRLYQFFTLSISFSFINIMLKRMCQIHYIT